MEVNVPLVLNDLPSLEYWKSVYENTLQAKIALKVSTGVYTRTRLAEAQNWKCCWCGKACTPQRYKSNSATIEHVQPQSEGGSNDWNNLAMACYSCNNNRGTLAWGEFDPKNAPLIDDAHKENKMLERYAKRGKEMLERGHDLNEWINTVRLTTAQRTKLVGLIEL